jgi:tetratricopeptide (TPR) repeat protein
MRVKEIFTITKGTKVIMAITFSVSMLALAFAFFYYRNINQSEDPRIKKARALLLHYEKVSGRITSYANFYLLDSANAIFRSFPDYASSFETGLIYNNKSSALLIMAIYDSSVNESEKSMLLNLSMRYCDSSISTYRGWIEEWDNLSADTIAERLRLHMKKDDPAFKGLNFNKVISRRVKNMVTAQVETPRRLSVSLTNKGTIYRHMMLPDSSLMCYQEALALWKDNRQAKSNMNVLLGGEPIKPTLIESLFPPDKNKE